MMLFDSCMAICNKTYEYKYKYLWKVFSFKEKGETFYDSLILEKMNRIVCWWKYSITCNDFVYNKS